MAEQVFSKQGELILVLSGDGILRDNIAELCIKWNVTPVTLSSHDAIHITKTLQLLAQHALVSEVDDDSSE